MANRGLVVGIVVLALDVGSDCDTVAVNFATVGLCWYRVVVGRGLRVSDSVSVSGADRDGEEESVALLLVSIRDNVAADGLEVSDVETD